tara:strand:+ start:474 stop:641 length:168 start_codon:yes stop_codon:yes gene_type:complete
MPKVIFRTEFFDNNRRYRTGVEYDISDDVTLPTTGIEVQKEEKKPKRTRPAGSEE